MPGNVLPSGYLVVEEAPVSFVQETPDSFVQLTIKGRKINGKQVSK